MQIIWNINSYSSEKENVVSLGTFDGVHLGHQAILSELKNRARQLNAIATMITFEPHPQLVVQHNGFPSIQILTTIEEKIQIFSSLGLDQLVVAHFTHTLAGMEPERFVDEILIQKLHMKEVIIGYDHAFGAGRSGNLQLLQNLGTKNKFTVSALSPVVIDGETVSSTKIRALLQQGSVKKAAKLMGHPYSISGQIIRGDARGRQLGFPTINVRLFSHYKLVPCNGIYATNSLIDGIIHRSVTYIGDRPTFNGIGEKIETYLFDFDQLIYGKEVEIQFIDFVRKDMKFNDEGDLINQIKQDIKVSLELLHNDAR